jgi:serine-type D-Ala-D-Ala carboxypeptidase
MDSFEEIDSYISAQVEHKTLPGAVLLIAKDGHVLHEKAYGYAKQFQIFMKGKDEKEYHYLEKMNKCKQEVTPPTPLSTDHLFDLASLTKVLATTFGIMLLIDQGKLQLDDKVKKYVSAFAHSGKSPITLRHLLTHTAGLAPWKPLYYHVDNREDAIPFIGQLPLHGEVSHDRHYSDLGFMVLAYLIEHISDRRLDEFLQDYLYAKLDLTNTLFNPHLKPHRNNKIASTSHGNPFEYKMIADNHFGYPCEEKIESFTQWRDYTLTGEVNDGNAYHVFSGVSGHAGLFSTATDIHVLLQLLINQGRYKQHQFIQSNTIQSFISRNHDQHSLGWVMSDYDTTGDLPLGEETISHTGFTGTFVFAIPAKKISLVLLTNVQNLGVNPDGRYNNLKIFRETIVKLALKLT